MKPLSIGNNIKRRLRCREQPIQSCIRFVFRGHGKFWIDDFGNQIDDIHFPNELMTTYGRELSFNQEMHATAEIYNRGPAIARTAVYAVEKGFQRTVELIFRS